MGLLRRSRPLRVLAILTAFLVGQMASFWHVAGEGHRWCEGHGRLEHASSTEDAERGSCCDAATDAPAPVRWTPADEGGVHEHGEHEACSIAGLDRPAAKTALRVSLPWSALPPCVVLAPVPSARVAHGPIALLDRSPKQSPPVA